MTDLAMQSTEHDLSELLGGFLRRKTSSAKELASLILCDPRTAEGFRAGRYWPSARHWKLIVQQFGRDVLSAVFDPEIDETLARLKREERELEERLHEIRVRQTQAAGGLAVYQERRAAAVDHLAPVDRDLFEDVRS